MNWLMDGWIFKDSSHIELTLLTSSPVRAIAELSQNRLSSQLTDAITTLDTHKQTHKAEHLKNGYILDDIEILLIVYIDNQPIPVVSELNPQYQWQTNTQK